MRLLLLLLWAGLLPGNALFFEGHKDLDLPAGYYASEVLGAPSACACRNRCFVHLLCTAFTVHLPASGEVNCFFSLANVTTGMMKPNASSWTFCKEGCAAPAAPAAVSTTPGPRCTGSFVDLGAIGCYHFHEATMSFASAQSYCQSLNADLATPSSLDPLRQYLLDNSYTGEYWVGLRRPNGWIDGRPDDPSEWDAGEPNDSGPCARLRGSSNFKAADHGCDNSYKVICEQEV
ncbi:attractin-like protein 1 [Penaeus chinensis]|uniref:attractin-like protein 1 n=1 Tax=Penaeus chinensis TaxID=139456 RepID=UPI001FB738A7|nr:attractin-like protein 1 [Penaeus chinensis]XP_047488911.1 attractin-like protein 1 [Penaeus chinensis]